ncbi:MAG: VanZ family protein [Lactimicrobium massiliense]|nr:VanZ family protein [Lactimicrobium massiliense]MDD6458758.1 VanZ family protein [Lactimicrobium massiliense]MDD6674082.1 VanZ family protein [Lactimicrobium massiliense]
MYTAVKYIDCLILLGLYLFFFLPRLKGQPKKNILLKSIYYLYLCIVFYGTLAPIVPTFDAPSINLIPFRDYFFAYGDYHRQIILNILLFMPMGFFMAWHRRKSILSTTLTCAAISFAIEVLQPWITINRVCDITDLITNTFGALLGCLLYRAFHRFLDAHNVLS